jgi:hypothetical protein
MAVGGKKKQEVSYAKHYGLAAYEVLGVNLSNKDLSELGFNIKEEDLEKEREFTKDKDGVDVVMIEFAVRSVGSNPRLRKFSFFLEDRNNRNKEGGEKGDLFQFINDQGSVAWSKNARVYEALNPQYAEYFTGKDDSLNPRPAKVGEEQFMSFMRNCMAIDYKAGGTISYNTKKLFRGNVKEIEGDLQTDFLSTILVATTIKLKEDEGGVKEIESFYPYAFAPGSYYRTVSQKGKFTDEDVEAIHLKIENNKGKSSGDRKWVTPLEQLIAKMTDKNYPCKDLYYLGVVKEFTGAEHIETSDSTILHSEDETSDTPAY